ncbi:phosphate ABC transporter permease subunit PstC [Emcibacter sp. SYSU 3D8]|uniref:phosphate ABC transporter permease subunit PstC n=1 Tax=Emcibacter sp. SYSU 3D8 TaxID=3133969 RepID=UPI0031FEDA76
MSTITIAFLTILGLSLSGFLLGAGRASRLRTTSGQHLHSLPSQHAAFVALWIVLPALLILIMWLLFQESMVQRFVLAAMPDSITAGLDQAQRDLLLSEIVNVNAGRIFQEPRPEVTEAARHYGALTETANWALVGVVAASCLAALAWAWTRINPQFRARNGVERILSGLMIMCSLIAILTTVGIVLSLLFEAFRFFQRVPLTEFFFGLRWEPQIAIRADQTAGYGAFGAVPVFTGTLLISAIALAVAIPIGLFSAVYLVEYANDRVRNIVKPIMELLAGIPTVVYGFFAVLIVSPAVVGGGGVIGVDVAPTSALVAGAVMGIMIIPFISSMSDDALTAVPRSLRDGSYAMGATKGETITKVLLPAALPGIVGGILLAASRAIGETMIVVMAAGLIANLSLNPLEGVTTVTVQIVSLLIGDTEFDNPKTLAAFALGLVLFLITLGLNIIALRVVQKYREQYD